MQECFVHVMNNCDDFVDSHVNVMTRDLPLTFPYNVTPLSSYVRVIVNFIFKLFFSSVIPIIL